MLIDFFVAQVDVSYDLLVKFTRKFFFMIGSVLHLKYHNEGKPQTHFSLFTFPGTFQRNGIQYTDSSPCIHCNDIVFQLYNHHNHHTRL